METLRFLMVTTFYPPYHLGGDAVHVQYLSEALAERGHEVHVEYSPAAFVVKRPTTDTPDVGHVGTVQLHPVSRPRQFSSPLGAYLLGDSRAAGKVHERIVRETKPDVIHLHNISLLGLGVTACAGDRPLLYTAHDYWFRCPRSDLLKRGRTPCESPSCLSCMILSHRLPPVWRGADVAARMHGVQCVIAPSRFMKRLATESFACPTVHIPNFVPDENPNGAVAPAAQYFLYAGVLERHKGLLELADAAPQYHGTKRIVLVGRGSLEKRLRERSARPGSQMDIRPWADRRTLSALYREAAALVMPSTCLENAPLAGIEALCWGTPLLTTSRGGVPELLHGGLAGTAFEPDADGIAQALDTFDTIPDTAPLRKAARKAYELHHCPAAYLGRYLALVRALLSGKRQGLADPTMGINPSSGQTAIQEA